MNKREIARTRYPAIRRAMGRERTQLNDAQLEAYVQEQLAGADALAVEDFMRNLQGVVL